MSTVNISIKDIFGAGKSCTVVFSPQSTPFIDGSSVIPTETKQVLTNNAGAASTTLEPGNYLVTFKGISSNEDEFLVGVPDDDLTYNLTDLIQSGAVVPDSTLSVIAELSAQLTSLQEQMTSIFDGTNLLVGTKFRITPLVNGGKIEVNNGTQWLDGPSYTA